jgi:hypothetical protein
MSNKDYPNWEEKLDAWAATYVPIDNHIANDCREGTDRFETYGKELEFVLSVANTEPNRVWTLVEGDDGNLFIISGYHLVNRLNYFITAKPFEGESFEVPYYIYDEEE